MKQYKCTYSYVGMETEGRVETWDTVIIPAPNKATAAYYYLILNNEPYMKNITLKEYKTQSYSEGGWGLNVEEI